MSRQRLTSGLQQALRAALGVSESLSARPGRGGGCINESCVVQVDGQSAPAAFLKLNHAGCLGMFEAEAEALGELAVRCEKTGLRVPRVFGCGVADEQAWLLLEHMPLTSGSTPGFAALGSGLARLHRVHSDSKCHGWRRDNHIGSTPQPNAWTRDWTAFFRDQRLRPQLELAAVRGRVFAQSSELLDALPELLAGHQPEPSLLHGDLWPGNAAFLPDGTPVIFDPASYFGDRETDIAFSRLFGGFPAAFYDAYEREWPLPTGHERRAPLYNLHHLLNHFNLFGEPYGRQAEQSIAALVRAARFNAGS